jgi:hypothetical protein
LEVEVQVEQGVLGVLEVSGEAVLVVVHRMAL